MSKNRKAFVLLSGGMDSTTCLHQAIFDFAPCPKDEIQIRSDGIMRLDHPSSVQAPKRWRSLVELGLGCDWVEAISVDYGQRHIKESQYAADTCQRLGIDHKILNIQGILDGKGVMLADANVEIPNISYDEIKGVSPTYVPFRNGTLLSLITAHAQKWVNAEIDLLADEASLRAIAHVGGLVDLSDFREAATKEAKDSVGIYFGAHAEDAANWAYPDCTPEFIGAMANAIYIGSYQTIRLYTPLQWSDKAAIVEYGTKLNVDWKNTWSCYAGGEKHCGTCPTCRARKQAFHIAGISDPTDYAKVEEVEEA